MNIHSGIHFLILPGKYLDVKSRSVQNFWHIWRKICIVLLNEAVDFPIIIFSDFFQKIYCTKILRFFPKVLFCPKYLPDRKVWNFFPKLFQNKFFQKCLAGGVVNFALIPSRLFYYLISIFYFCWKFGHCKACTKSRQLRR